MNYACFILGGRQGLIMNSIETTAESNEEICVARARGRLQYKMEVVEGWQKKKYPHCRKLCFLLCASPLQSSISSHGPEQTWRRLWLTRRSLGMTWGCPLLMYVCMYVCILQPKPTISQYQAAYLYTPRHQVTDVTSPHKRSHFQFYDTHKT